MRRPPLTPVTMMGPVEPSVDVVTTTTVSEGFAVIVDAPAPVEPESDSDGAARDKKLTVGSASNGPPYGAG